MPNLAFGYVVFVGIGTLISSWFSGPEAACENSAGEYLMMLPLRLSLILHCGDESSKSELDSLKGSFEDFSPPLADTESVSSSPSSGSTSAVGAILRANPDFGTCGMF